MVRKYKDSDLSYLEQQNMLASLEIQYHGDVFPDAKFVSEDSDGVCHGVLYFRKHYTYDSSYEELNMVILNIYTEEDGPYEELLQCAKDWCKEQADKHPEKKICLVTWLEPEEKDDIQCYLHNGFIEYEVCPCLKYDLAKVPDEIDIPQGMTIKSLEFNPEEMEKYILATAEANNGTRDNANELWFTHAGVPCSVYMLMDGEKIVGATSTWKITEERSAIENIFTVPQYRRQGMARVIITYALMQAKKEGYQIGTLGMLGRNLKASRLYQSLGFELYYQQIEMVYLPVE